MPKQRTYATSADDFPLAPGLNAYLVWPEIPKGARCRRSAWVTIVAVLGPAKVRVRFLSGVCVSYPPEMIFLQYTNARREINR